MDTNSLQLCAGKLFKNVAAGIMLLMLFIFLSSNRDVKKGYSKTGEIGQNKNETKPRLFLIAVIDSHDKIIGTRCQTDLEELMGNFEEFSEWLDIATVTEKIIDGDQFGKAAVNDALENWLPSQEPGNADIIVFYFSGHGFRLPNDRSVYPRMWLKTSSDQNPETANLRMEEDIYNRIIKMGAGLNIVLSDCCNSVPGANTSFAAGTITSGKPSPPSGEELEEDRKDFDQLFMPDDPISIIATAADSTELAGGTPAVGGFFTHYFLEALDKCIYDDDLEPSWETIINYASEEARKKALGGACPDNKHNEKGRCIQTAKFRIITKEPAE